MDILTTSEHIIEIPAETMAEFLRIEAREKAIMFVVLQNEIQRLKNQNNALVNYNNALVNYNGALTTFTIQR